MEQNARKFGVFVATLAMIASLLVVPTTSADGSEDLEMELFGDSGVTSYASDIGYANFTADITSAAGTAHNDVTVAVEFVDVTDGTWDAGIATISDCAGDGSQVSNVTGDLSEGAIMTVCISVDLDAATGSAEARDSARMKVSVTSDEDDTEGFDDAEGFIKLVNWMASSDDGIQAFVESDSETDVCSEKPSCQSYTINVTNIRLSLDSSGNRIDNATDEVITVRLGELTEGWRLNSSYEGWDPMYSEATINGLSAGQTVTLVFDVTLAGNDVPASDYLKENNQIIFETRDDNGYYDSVTLYATVATNYGVFVSGESTISTVDNGCTPDVDATVEWSVVIQNGGNNWDTFDIDFGLTDTLAAGWDVTSEGGSLPDETIVLDRYNPNPTSTTDVSTFKISMSIPGGLDADTSHGFTMDVTSKGDDTLSTTVSFASTVAQCYDISLSVAPVSTAANPGSLAIFNATVTNNGNGNDTVSFTSMGPVAWLPTLLESSAEIARDSSASVDFTITVPADAEAGAPLPGGAMIHAYSEGCNGVTAGCTYEDHETVSVTTNQIYAITAGYYTNESGDVKSSVSVEEGGQLSMFATVSNGGNGGDRVSLELIGAPSWVVLEKETALIYSNDSVDVAMSINAPASESLGEFTFTLKATSQDGNTTSSTGTLTITVKERDTSADGPDTETVDDDEGLPGFGALSALAAIGVALVLRRRF